MTSVNFRPRRLGHVNLWVSDLEKSIEFYESVCGIELVRRERAILIAFHSNGNTHHDIGLVEISKGQDRFGRNGLLQIPKTRGLHVGLNHLGWEMTTEAELVDAIRRAEDAKVPLARTMDHLISHSAYINDPDGNGHEFYADQMRDWESIYNLDNEDEVTSDWDPYANPPSTERNYNQSFRVRRVDGAPLHPSHLTGCRFATARFDAMRQFFTSVAGLTVVDEDTTPASRRMRLADAVGRPDITVVETAPGEPTGLRGFSFALAEPHDLPAVVRQLSEQGVETVMQGEALCVKDPDGFAVEFH
jgi:catechol 2,3-dioxygenase